MHELTQCNAHEKILFGDGHYPGLLTRITIVEKTVDAIKFYARWLVLLVGGLLVTSVVGLILRR